MILQLSEVNFDVVLKLLKGIFIYPTDTIYGIGCDAENEKLVNKIREIKNRDQKPFSVIAPNFDYILENCEVDEVLLKKYLPGPYTLILKKKKNDFLSHVSNTDFIGMRIPHHPLNKIFQRTGKPIITTSVNFVGEKPANKIEEVKRNILNKVDFVIDAGELSGKVSILIKEGKEIKR